MEQRTKLRDQIIFDECEVLESGYGIRRFQNLDPGRLQNLIVEHLASLDVSQNEGPSIKGFRDFGYTDNIGLKRKIFFEGYVYTDVYDEADLSPTIDGIREVVPANDIAGICRFVNRFHNADEFNMDIHGDLVYMRAWWD